jgi:hypothetical protein
MNSPLVWIHVDALSPAQPALRTYPEAPALFVFDDEEMEAERWTLKRVQFVYECLLEIPCEIVRGDVVNEVLEYAERIGAARAVTMDTPHPRRRAQMDRIAARLPLEIVPDEPFSDGGPPLDPRHLKRFSKYWNAILGSDPDLKGTSK